MNNRVETMLLGAVKSSRQTVNYNPDQWHIFHSSPRHYEHTFRHLLGSKRIKDLLQNRRVPTVIDLLSTPHMISSIFEELPQAEKVGISVSISDDRDSVTRDRDSDLGISHISGDITSARTWREIINVLNGRQADLIVERGEGAVKGAGTVPYTPSFYYHALSKMWSMLTGESGIILAQFSPLYSSDHLRSIYADYIKHLKKCGIRVKSRTIPRYDDSCNDNVLMLTKTTDSPERLPALDANQFTKLSKADLLIAHF